MLREIIGNNLRILRKRLRLSQQKVADKTDMVQKDISKIENGMENIGVDKLEQICKGLGVHPSELVTDPYGISPKDLLKQKCYRKGVIELLYSYYLLITKIYDPETFHKSYQTYGIGIRDQSVPCIRDVSTDREFVESIIELCNFYQVEPIHLIDIVEDSLFQRDT